MTTDAQQQQTVVALGYCRVSTDGQGADGLGMAAQEAALRAEAERRGWQLELVVEVASAGSMKKRPALAAALARLDAGEAQVLLALRLDRLARSVVDMVNVADRAERYGWQLATADGAVDSTSLSGRLLLELLAVFSAHERRMIRERTRAALAQKRARGERTGHPVALPDELRQRIVQMRADGMSQSAIARQLQAEQVPTARGGTWYQSTVAHVLASVRLDAELASRRAARATSAA
jgi:DNA invertase Pin-like site-specific DNA recombinase